MKLFLDTANIDEIRRAADWAVLDGVTTNPSLVAKETGKDFRSILKEICEIVDGPISAEVTSTKADEMVRQGEDLAKLHENIVVKCQLTADGLKATRALAKKGIPVNVTLCFSANQALLAAKAGAAYISPFVGRLDDVSHDGMDLLRQIVAIYNNYDFETEVLAASVRHPVHVVECALAGADIATLPYKVLEQMVKHPLTDRGLEQFLKDWEKVPKS
ncbi:MAG TPA: fructose-6-phosphate aldolase [Candidatus Thermoplasmatota archaeon]|nr:fructose-6-phosphate aldolase [Candidatus Thermoplasmatota archaeon]